MTLVTHRVLDGAQLDLEADLDLTAPFSSVVDVGLDGHRYEFTAGAPGLGEQVAAAAGLDGFAEEYSYAGGTLLVGRATVRDPRTRVADDLTVVAWRGARYGLVTSLYHTTTAGVLRLLKTVRIEEHHDGLSITPAPRSASTLLGAQVLKQVPGLGLLEITGRTRQAAAQLPSWPGMRLPAGELFRDTLSNGAPYFVLAARTVMVTVLPLADTALDAVPSLLGRMRIALRAPAW